jgi:hypothetical protein
MAIGAAWLAGDWGLCSKRIKNGSIANFNFWAKFAHQASAL